MESRRVRMRKSVGGNRHAKRRHRWRTSVGYYGEPGVLRDHGGSGCLYPFGIGAYSACYQCGVASAQCGGIGSPGAVVSLCQVTLLASSPSLHHAYHGSLVTPVGLFLDFPVSPRTRVRDV